MKLKDAALAAACLCVSVMLLLGAQWAGEGAAEGLRICGSIIIPSLFPFMALASFVAGTPVSVALRQFMSLPARLIWGLPPAAAPALAMSLIGGYPAGARVLAASVDAGDITPQEASAALCCCIHSGPAFMAGVVGGTLLGSVRAGLALYLCQAAAGAVTGRIMGLCGRRTSAEAGAPPAKRGGGRYRPVSAVFVDSVAEGMKGILVICAFVVLFSAVLGVLRGWGALSAAAGALSELSGGALTRSGAELFIRGSVEICSGCGAAAGVPVSQLVRTLPFLLSFSSLSVICQVTAVISGRGVRMGPFVLSRLIHGLVTAAVAYPVISAYAASQAFSAFGRPVVAADGFTLAGTLCILAMCAILFSVLPAQKAKNAAKNFGEKR